MHAGTRILITETQHLQWATDTSQATFLPCPVEGTLVRVYEDESEHLFATVWEIVLDDGGTIFVPEKYFTVTLSVDLVSQDTDTQ